MELTLQSRSEYDKLRSGEMTPAMAAEYLRDGKIRTRGFAETLRQLYPGLDLQARITAALQEDDPGANPESVARRVRNCLAGQNQPVNREEIFRIAFALGLGEGDASHLLGLCTGYGIHYREGRDVVYAWFLRMGKDYAQARDFFATLPPVERPDGLPEAGVQPPDPRAAKPVPPGPDPGGPAGVLPVQPGQAGGAPRPGLFLL